MQGCRLEWEVKNKSRENQMRKSIFKALLITLIIIYSQQAYAIWAPSEFVKVKDTHIRKIVKNFLKNQKNQTLTNDTEIYVFVPKRTITGDPSKFKTKRDFSDKSLIILLAGKEWCNKKGCRLFSIYKDKNDKWKEWFSTVSNGCVTISDNYREDKQGWFSHIYVGDNFGVKAILFKEGKNKELYEKFKKGEKCEKSLKSLEKFYK